MFARVQVFEQGIERKIPTKHVLGKRSPLNFGFAGIRRVTFFACRDKFHLTFGAVGQGKVKHRSSKTLIDNGIMCGNTLSVEKAGKRRGIFFQNQIKVIGERQAKQTIP